MRPGCRSSSTQTPTPTLTLTLTLTLIPTSTLTRLPQQLSISEDGVCALFLGGRLGGNRCVRACAPLPVSPYHALRPQCSAPPSPPGCPALPPASPRSVCSNAASSGGSGCRLCPLPTAGYRLERGCCTGYFEVSILSPPYGRGTAGHGFEVSCIAVGVCTSRFVCDGRQPGWDGESYLLLATHY